MWVRRTDRWTSRRATDDASQIARANSRERVANACHRGIIGSGRVSERAEFRAAAAPRETTPGNRP